MIQSQKCRFASLMGGKGTSEVMWSEAEAGDDKEMFGQQRREQLTYLFRKLRPNLGEVLE
jgi:hypothetical protein